MKEWMQMKLRKEQEKMEKKREEEEKVRREEEQRRLWQEQERRQTELRRLNEETELRIISTVAREMHHFIAEIRNDIQTALGARSRIPKEKGKGKAKTLDDHAADELLKYLQGEIAESFREGAELEKEEVKQLRWKFRQLVITQVDKNRGELVLMCPSTYQHALKKMFIYNNAYIRTSGEETEILAGMRADYKAAGLEKVAAWNGKGRIGNAYVLPKHKDLSKWRPIAPANTEPTRTGSRRLGRALNALLARLPAAEHFNIGAITQLKENLRMIEEKHGCKKESAMMVLRSYDIKEMFTSLPHEAIVEAVEWLLREWERKGRTKIVGIPMGKNFSPPLACILCAKYETKFIRSLGKDRALFHGIRFMDDVATTVLMDRRREESFHQAEEIMKAFENCYGEKLTLLRTDVGDNTINFIGAKVSVEADPVRFMVAPQMKNQDWITDGMMPFKSF
ncbi:hypothetical protein CBR_g21022 [Chara braunii]|uniref:Reverse transcriptase domain-containing protein n=1 Tax=Chara braunii TaxID=69332 RepID=A0A388L0I1_CHABU|nr:hypothetical protein CBR_g21022 [Chara braunii]|eukprot:GBG75778.1 hypothetical protein CBR_g21022 [Chara braunii]